MSAFSVVGVEPWGKRVGAVGVGGEGLPVGPFDLQGAVESLDFAVLPGAMGPDELVCDAPLVQECANVAGEPVGEVVVRD